ncbi:AMP binding enzyme [Ceratobasidium sp. AG-Ba]|nr:AMP binding enzyme [Ceratobasidium sp. AG-Ba]
MKGTDGRPSLTSAPPRRLQGTPRQDYWHRLERVVGQGSKRNIVLAPPVRDRTRGSFEEGDIAWFPEGGLNASYNCLDRWAFQNPDKPAIIYEADDPEFGVKKGDTVSIYLPMTWHAAAAFLACARMSRVVITTDEGRRGGKTIATKAIVDSALKAAPGVEHVLVLKRTGRDKWWHEEAAKVRATAPEIGVVHTTGGYLLGAALTVKYVFDVHPEDKFACMADIGWITGHTYIIYGPLLNGVTTTIFESTPVYPTPSRYWDVVQRHKIPSSTPLHRHPSPPSTLRVLGSVGEPINPEAWTWYNDNVGKKQCAIVDTFWQTETGSIVITPIPGAVPTKPGSATVPFWGIEPVILDPVSGKELEGNNVEGVLCIRKPWPSIARSVYKDHARYLDTYLKPYPGYYFTGDGAARDQDGYIWIKGRVDDVINVSGHRLSTAEIESALIMHAGVAETAVIGTADELTGQAVHSFVTLKPEFEYDPSQSGALVKELTLQVRKVIGPFAAPKQIYIVNDLPKTRSGKIMRRVMRKIVAGEADQLGDLSTLADPSVVDQIKEQVEKAQRK